MRRQASHAPASEWLPSRNRTIASFSDAGPEIPAAWIPYKTVIDQP